MNLKLKTIARTPHSEEVAIFDVDTRDENDQAVNIGKLEMHFLADQIVGTLLIWQEYATGFSRTHPAGSEVTLDTLIEEILAEATEPLGIPGEYGIEVYFASVQEHQFISNYAEEEESEEPPAEEVTTGEEDEFAERLRSRP